MKFNYQDLAYHIDKVEGEMIQEMYFLFSTYKLDKELCGNIPEGMLIPSCEDLEDMRSQLVSIFKQRHKVFEENDLYKENWL
jgi:hypothetical protein